MLLIIINYMILFEEHQVVFYIQIIPKMKTLPIHCQVLIVMAFLLQKMLIKMDRIIMGMIMSLGVGRLVVQQYQTLMELLHHQYL